MLPSRMDALRAPGFSYGSQHRYKTFLTACINCCTMPTKVSNKGRVHKALTDGQLGPCIPTSLEGQDGYTLT